jgi:hypothetical protein
MNTIKYFFCLVISSLFIFQSCSLEKRRYTNGYDIQWKKNSNATASHHTKTNVAEVKKEHIEAKYNSSPTENVISDASFKELTASSEKKKGIVLLNTDSTRCDTIVMRDGTEIKAKVVEITPTEIKYKYCNNINGPTYVIYRYNASYIKYPNGTAESFINEYPPGPSYNNRNANNNNRNTNMGASINNYGMSEYVRRKSLASLILGILSFFIPYIGFFTAIAAVIFGRKCISLIKNDPENLWRYTKRATAGFILGLIVLVIYVLIIALLLIALAL